MPYIATNKRFSVLLKKYIFCYYLNQSQYQINSSVGFAVEAAFLVFRNSCFHVPIINLNYHSRDKKCEITLIIGYFNENDARQAQGNITFLDISFQNSVFLGTNPNFFSWVVRWMVGGPNGTGLTPQKTSNFWRKNAQTFGVFWWKKLKSNFLQTGMSQGLQSFYTFGRYYKALQPLLLALFTQTISQRNISRSVSQGKNDRTGRDCNSKKSCFQQCIEFWFLIVSRKESLPKKLLKWL